MADYCEFSEFSVLNFPVVGEGDWIGRKVIGFDGGGV